MRSDSDSETETETGTPLADEPATEGVPTDTPPSGLPDEDSPEEGPLGTPEDDDAAASGAAAMPGIPTDGEPPSSG